MTQQVWEQDEIIQPAPQQPAAPQPTRPTAPRPAPGIIQGRPAPPDPLEEENARLRREANDRANANEGRQQAAFEGRGGGLTESQSKAVNFYQRSASANVDYERLNLSPEGLAGLFGQQAAPNVLASISNDDRNAARAAIENFISAALRLESGATIGDDEFERQYRIYFPSPNAGPEEIEQKRRQRQLAISGFAASAGPDGLDSANTNLVNLGYTDEDGNLIISFTPPTEPTGSGQVPTGQQGDRQITAGDMYPSGVELGFDTMGRDDPMDRNRALIKYFGLESASDEDRIIGYWNSQRNNANLSVDDARSWYQQQGYPIPTEEDLAEAVDAARSGITFQGFDMRDVEANRMEVLDNELERRGANPESQAWTGVAGVAQGLTLEHTDEIGAALAAIPSAFSEGGYVDAYRNERDLNRRYNERGEDANPGTALAGRLVGGLATGGVRIGQTAPQAARFAYRVGREAGNAPAVARTAAAAASRNAAGREGAILGGLAGFGTGEGAADSAGNALLGTLGGAVVGQGMQAGFNALAPQARQATAFVRNALPSSNRVRPPKPQTRQDAEEVLGAAGRRGLSRNVARADIDPASRKPRADAMQTSGRQQLNAAEQEDLQAMEGALMRELGAEGGDSAAETFGRGERIQTGVTNVVDRIRTRAGNLYDRARRRSRGVTVQPTTALRVVNEQIAELESGGRNSNRAAIEFLEGLRDDLSGAPNPGPSLHREMDIEEALYHIPESGWSRTAPRGTAEQFASRTPELALGQGGNRGVVLEFAEDGLQARRSTTKPAEGLMEQSGQGEYIVSAQPYEIGQRLRSITIAPNAEARSGASGAFQSTLRRLEDAGWERVEMPGGGIRFTRPREGVGIDLLRGQRTNLRGNINTNNLSMTDTERRAGLVLDALSEDIKQGLRGNPALGDFRRADRLWREQAEFQNTIVRKLVGPGGNVPAETAARRIQAFIGNDFARARELVNQLEPDARRAMREQIAASLGRSRNGEFSIAQFLTHTGDGAGNMIPPRTQRLLFGEEGVAAIRDLRILATAKRNAADPSNRSNTGGLIQGAKNSFRRLLLGSAGFGIVLDATGGMGLASLASAGTALGGELAARLGQERTLRLLLNRDFTRLLRRLPDSSDPRAIDQWFDRARSVASRTPGMEADVQELARVVLDLANGNATGATRTVAEEEPQTN